MDYVVGVDGGGTKTAAVIMDTAGRVLGCGEGGPSTYGVVPEEFTRSSIAEAIAQASRAGGLSTTGFKAAFLGLGNVVSEIDRTAVRRIAAGLGLAPYEKIGVDHDCRIALAGGLSCRPGIVLIAGTGTSCFGMNSQGQSWRSGGWGPLIDDDGSSYWLGIQAMRAAVQDYDGRGQPTQLTQAVIERLHLPDMNELMNHLYASEMTRTEIAALAPLVFAAAAAGDAPAVDLIRTGCAAMAESVAAVARRLGLEQSPTELAVVGGLINAGDAFFQPLETAVHQRLPHCQVRPAELLPALGAALLALQLAGQPLDAAILDTVHLHTHNHLPTG